MQFFNGRTTRFEMIWVRTPEFFNFFMIPFESNPQNQPKPTSRKMIQPQMFPAGWQQIDLKIRWPAAPSSDRWLVQIVCLDPLYDSNNFAKNDLFVCLFVCLQIVRFFFPCAFFYGRQRLFRRSRLSAARVKAVALDRQPLPQATAVASHLTHVIQVQARSALWLLFWESCEWFWLDLVWSPHVFCMFLCWWCFCSFEKCVIRILQQWRRLLGSSWCIANQICVGATVTVYLACS